MLRRDGAAELLDRLSALPTRVDCQLETSQGAVALAELAMTSEQILFRTRNGPELVARTARAAIVTAHHHDTTSPPSDRKCRQAAPAGRRP